MKVSCTVLESSGSREGVADFTWKELLNSYFDISTRQATMGIKVRYPDLPFRTIAIIGILLLGLLCGGCSAFLASAGTDSGVYQERTLHSPDGIGKFYMGREIAKVMGHTKALWLERPDRK